MSAVNFRTRAGQLKRARTRSRILQAAFELFDARGVDQVTVEDVRDAAGLARGSFYNYFVTYEEMLRELAGEIGRQIVKEQDQFNGIADMAERLWFNLRYAILRTASDHSCGEVLARVTPLVGPLTETMRQRSEQDLRLSTRRGDLKVASHGVALDLGYGMASMMIRRIIRDGLVVKDLEAAGQMILLAFGVADREARRIARTPLPKLPETPLRQAVIENFGVN